MCLLIETIKIVDGQFQNLAYHNIRFNKARWDLFACTEDVDIASLIAIPDDGRMGIYKCTVTYNAKVIDVKFQAYIIRKISSLKIVVDDNIDYSYKYANRDSLNELLKKKEECDEILIVKNNLITDTSFSNIVFYDGSQWITPDKPLLNGTKRQRLIHDGLIIESEINKDSVTSFSNACLINAMLDMGDILLDCKNIK
jgi:4-amino-4-deoxychorismate lyase